MITDICHYLTGFLSNRKYCRNLPLRASRMPSAKTPRPSQKKYVIIPIPSLLKITIVDAKHVRCLKPVLRKMYVVISDAHMHAGSVSSAIQRITVRIILHMTAIVLPERSLLMSAMVAKTLICAIWSISITTQSRRKGSTK